jgi:hypothetical protein
MQKDCRSNPCPAAVTGFWRLLALHAKGTSCGAHPERSPVNQNGTYLGPRAPAHSTRGTP